MSWILSKKNCRIFWIFLVCKLKWFTGDYLHIWTIHFFKIYWPENIKNFGYIFLWLLAECFHWNSTFNSWNSKNVLCSKKHFKKCTFCLCFKIQSIFFQELITLIWQKLLNHSRAILKYLLKILTTLLNGPSLSCICFNLIHFMQSCSVNKQYIVIKRRRK